MKRFPFISTVLIALLTATPSQAQSASNFGKPIAARPTPTAAESKSSAANTDLRSTPSRNLGEQSGEFVELIEATFAMNGRNFDPFGRHQDPNYEPPAPPEPEVIEEKSAPSPVTPFADIVAAIRITMVMPSEQSFLVGGRNFKVGDRIMLNMGNGRMLPIFVKSVEANSVVFRHGENNTLATLSLSLLPQGISRGLSAKPPGVVASGSSEPLIIDAPTPYSSAR